MQNRKTSVFLLLLCFLTIAQQVSSQVKYSHPAVGDEFIGPFASWLNVRTSYGAKGDGVADDTDAIQRAINDVGLYTQKASVIYLPAGIYRITRTLVVRDKMRISIVGADPVNTRIRWHGAKNGTMLLVDGVAYSQFNRMIFDGNKTAEIAVDQSWDGVGGFFDTGNEYADDTFVDVGYGIHGGFRHKTSFAETAIMRCKFIRNTIAGLALGNFNALDIWVWHSIFEDCAVGATNDLKVGAAGGFKIYNSLFRRSKVADILIGNTVEFSFRDNVSIGSKTFIHAEKTPNPAPIILQGNVIIDPIDNLAIDIQNQGQVTMLDNVVRSRPGAKAPIAAITGPPDSDCLAIGNTFTVASPIQSNRAVIYNTSVVSTASLANLGPQTMPGFEPNLKRKIYEVPKNAKAVDIQKIIDQASLLKGQRPVIHFPFGFFHLDRSLVIPAGSDVQLVGDSYWTVLTWTGTGKGNIIRIEGPSKATVKNLTLTGKSIGNGILVTNVDQPGSRIYTHENELHNNKTGYMVNGLDNAQLFFANAGYTRTNKAVRVMGGPNALAGNPVKGRTIIYAACATDNDITYNVSNGGNLLVRDAWYESRFVNGFLDLQKAGIFTIEGSHIAHTNLDKSRPQSKLTDWKGRATFLNSYMTDKIVVTGDASRTEVVTLGAHVERDDFISDWASKKGVIRIINARSRQLKIAGTGSYQLKNRSEATQAELFAAMEPVRTARTEVLKPLAASITDLRLHRIFVDYTDTAIHFLGGNGSDFAILKPSVTLTKTYQKNAGSQIEWVAENEDEFSGYEIEKSTDGKYFTRIGTMHKRRTTQLITDYEWHDPNPAPGKNYYRVKAVLASGEQQLTKIMHVEHGTNSFKVFPNPIVGDKVTVQFHNAAKGDYVISFITTSGQTLYNKKHSHPGGSANVDIPVSHTLPAGNYTIHLKGESKTESWILKK